MSRRPSRDVFRSSTTSSAIPVLLCSPSLWIRIILSLISCSRTISTWHSLSPTWKKASTRLPFSLAMTLERCGPMLSRCTVTTLTDTNRSWVSRSTLRISLAIWTISLSTRTRVFQTSPMRTLSTLLKWTNSLIRESKRCKMKSKVSRILNRLRKQIACKALEHKTKSLPSSNKPNKQLLMTSKWQWKKRRS